MDEIISDFKINGSTMLLSNDTNEYIVYEQIIKGIDVLPIEESFYKFHFRVIDDEVILLSNARISYNVFIKEYIELAMYFTKINIGEEESILNTKLLSFIKNKPSTYQTLYS